MITSLVHLASKAGIEIDGCRKRVTALCGETVKGIYFSPVGSYDSGALPVCPACRTRAHSARFRAIGRELPSDAKH